MEKQQNTQPIIQHSYYWHQYSSCQFSHTGMMTIDSQFSWLAPWGPRSKSCRRQDVVAMATERYNVPTTLPCKASYPK